MFDAAGVRSEVAGNIGRPLTDARRRGRSGTRGWSASSRPSSSRTSESLRPRIAVLTEPRARPPRPPRHLRGLRGREAPGVRAPGPGRCRRRAARVRADSGRGAAHRVRGRRSAARRAAAFPARTTARTPPPRRPPPAPPASRTTRSREALRTFPGVEHRIEDVATIAGVRYVNDSKATNVAAALRALASFPGARLHVILGGRGKDESYAPLAEAFAPG